jgi:beta-mannosidase
VGQLLQAEAIKLAIEAHRSDMPYCMGSLYWQLNDCWPVASWSGIDAYGRWKALHYFVRDAFKNTIIVVDKSNDDLNFNIISDEMGAEVFDLHVRLMDFDGKVLMEKDEKVEMSGNQSRMVYQIPDSEIRALGDPQAMVLVANLESKGENVDRAIHYFAKARDLKLPKPNIKWRINSENGQSNIVLESAVLAKNVFLIGDDCHFSDNFFDLLPGEKKQVAIQTTLDPDSLAHQIKILHLEETMRRE